MHYVPESPTEFLADKPAGDLPGDANVHWQSAPVYLLTAVVGLLLLLDLLSGLIPGWQDYQSIYGVRIALLAAVLGGARILYQTLDELFDGKFTAGIALSIAIVAAIALQEYSTAALVVFIALIGESIEGYTVDKARQAIRSAFDLWPAMAHVVRGDSEVDIPLEDIVVGDKVIVKPGERIPVDGQVIAGTGSVDESALTGESFPVDKQSGDNIFTGTLNQHSALTVRTNKIGNDSTLGQVVRLVSDSVSRKAPIERTADRMAKWFLPAVLLAALCTLLGWRITSGEWAAGFRPALAVLVVACPCPLILATPTAVMAALAWLSKHGIIVKGSAVLERLAAVDTIAFDKTGTLTVGEPTVGQILVADGYTKDAVLRTAAMAERRSEHVLAKAIVMAAEAQGLVVPGLEELATMPGSGIVAKARSTQLGPWSIAQSEAVGKQAHEHHRWIVVGNRRLLEAESVRIDDATNRWQQQLDLAGETPLLVAVDSQVIGAIGVRDSVRTDTQSALSALKQAGIESITMLTGDRSSVAASIATSLGVTAVQSEMLPADKANWVEQKQAANKTVAFVGDGINDAPGLAIADVGIAIRRSGSELAAEAGDVILMGDPIRPLPDLLRLAKHFVRNVKQSIFIFAFGVNVLGVILCAWGILGPVAGAVLHEIASLAVMLNAVRLLWFRSSIDAAAGLSASETAAPGAIPLSQRIEQSAERIVTLLSPSQIVFAALRNRTRLARFALALAAVWWLTTGLVRIGSDEQAIVTRFGKATDELQPGTYWRWPVPFECVYREQVAKVRTVRIGEIQTDVQNQSQTGYLPTVEWTSNHAHDVLASTETPLVLTADALPIEATLDVQYRISDLNKFVFSSTDVESAIKAIAESTLHQVTAATSLNDFLTTGRPAVEQRCVQSISALTDQYGLGIEIVAVNLLDAHPPRTVVPAYRDVADAIEQKQTLINEAEQYRSNRHYSAVGEQLANQIDGGFDDKKWRSIVDDSQDLLAGQAATTLLTAKQQYATRIESSRGAAARFSSLADVREQFRRFTSHHLYWKTVDAAFSNRKLTIIDPSTSQHQKLMLIDPDKLTESRLPAFTTEGEPQPDNPSNINQPSDNRE